MENLSKYLHPLNVRLNELLLDPNNPRFAELGDEVEPVPEPRFAESKIQKEAFEKMKSDRFDVAELRDGMKTIGFLPMDKIVVREWHSDQDEDKKYVVVEGNRRVTALKWLIDLHETGRGTLTTDQIENFTNLEVLLLDDKHAPAASKWILPGLRHVSGIKEWGPYQKARAVFSLREAGGSPQEVAQSLGLSVRGANQLWRSYLALERMRKDEEYGDYAQPRHYSYFEEIFKRPDVKTWLDWDDNERKFKDDAKTKEMYGWIVGEPDDDGNMQDPKLPEAKSVRELGQVIRDEAALAEFRSQNGSLARALAKYELDHPEDWQPAIVKAESVLASLPADSLRRLTGDEITKLENLKRRIDTVLTDRSKLIS